MASKLNPKDVTWGWLGYSRAPAGGRGPTRHGGAPARREITLSLKHIPTGVTVTETALGPFTRSQAKAAKAKLWEQLWARLEGEVAKSLRLPGR